MTKLLKLLLSLSFALLLTSCQRDMSSDYLMRHPDVLKQEIERCHANETKTREVASRCEVVMSAAERFIKLLNEQQSNPEKFGVRIMEAQAACAKSILTSTSTIDTAACHDVKILLAVIGVNSPE